MLAEQVSEALGMPLLQWHIKSTTKAQQGLYEYDAVSRLRDSQLGDEKVKDIHNYIVKGVLWQAFTADKPAVGMYHAHMHGEKGLPNGLFGAFQVGDVPLPGGANQWSPQRVLLDGKPIATYLDAANIVHFFRRRRPGQIRGISEFVSALGVISQLRRYGIAVLGAAEFAASINGVMETNAEVEDGPAAVVPMENFRLENGMVMTLPAGWKANQFKAEQPTSSFKEFNAEKLNQVARCVNAPFNVMTGNSSGYNYSSGRLDHVPYHRNVWIDREELEISVLDRTFEKWHAEAVAVGEIPESFATIEDFDWLFQWDGFNSIDPLKDAQASRERMSLGLTTLSAAAMTALPAAGQDVLEEIVVTARFREENLQQTPLAITAVTGSMLEARGATSTVS